MSRLAWTLLLVLVIAGCSGSAERVTDRHPAPGANKSTPAAPDTRALEASARGFSFRSGPPSEPEWLRNFVNSLSKEQILKANRIYLETGTFHRNPDSRGLHYSELTDSQKQQIQVFWHNREQAWRERGFNPYEQPRHKVKVAPVEETQIYFVGWRLGPRGLNNQTMLSCYLDRGEFGTESHASYDGVLELPPAMRQAAIDLATIDTDPEGDWRIEVK